MKVEFIFNWKTFTAIGFAVAGIITAIKITPEIAEAISIHAIDSAKEVAVARKSNS